MIRANVGEAQVISDQKAYCGWPTMAQLDSGDLLVVFSGGREQHICPYGKIQLMRSTNEGAHWSPVETLVDGPLDDRDAAIMETREGTLILTWFTSLAWLRNLFRMEVGMMPYPADRTNLVRWREIRATLAETIDPRVELAMFCKRSTDGGTTWSERIRTPVTSVHGPRQLADGRLIQVGPRYDESFAGMVSGAAFSGTPIAVAMSEDDGQSWRITGDLPLPPELQGRCCEPMVFPTAEGAILVQLRFHPADAIDGRYGDILQCESTDDGETWTKPRRLQVNGFPSHLMQLRDGRLVMSYGFREPDNFGVRACVSDDNGATWSAPMILHDDGITHDLGYPSTVELSDGSLLTIWYERTAEPRVSPAVLKQTYWRLEP